MNARHQPSLRIAQTSLRVIKADSADGGVDRHLARRDGVAQTSRKLRGVTTQNGPCAKCHKPTHRYGHGGNPLCTECRALLPPKKASAR